MSTKLLTSNVNINDLFKNDLKLNLRPICLKKLMNLTSHGKSKAFAFERWVTVDHGCMRHRMILSSYIVLRIVFPYLK